MGRYCSECGDWCDRDEFSYNQWRKGDGYSRCYDCVNGVNDYEAEEGVDCAQCGHWCERSEFSNNQWRKGEGYARCSDCVNGVNDTSSEEGEEGLECAQCGQWCERDEFTNNQWRKGEGFARCSDCVHGVNHSSSSSEEEDKGLYCSECGNWCEREEFTNNQWRKGEGNARCSDCVHGCSYQCHECGRVFDNYNNLKMHLQVHRPREVACPLCGERRFQSGANAVQHVESGYCSACRGAANARNQIYQFASSQAAMRPYMSDTPMLTNGGYRDGRTPDFPYHCGRCNKYFRQMSQLLQHNDNKHGQQHRMLGF